MFTTFTLECFFFFLASPPPPYAHKIGQYYSRLCKCCHFSQSKVTISSFYMTLLGITRSDAYLGVQTSSFLPSKYGDFWPVFQQKKIICRFQTTFFFLCCQVVKFHPKKKAQEQVCLHVWISSYAHEIAWARYFQMINTCLVKFCILFVSFSNNCG
jgi:hypothetical protein